MTAAATQTPLITFDEYLKRVEQTEEKLDFVNGHVVNVSQLIAMAGGSETHSLIITNLIGETRSKLKGKPCRVYDSNLRVGSGTGNTTHYPDATIICGQSVAAPRDKSGHTYTNPTAVFEVLSPSTMAYDFGDKFGEYAKIDSLREYVLIRQDRCEIITFYRHDDGGWKTLVYTDRAGQVPIESVGIELSVAEVYDGVTLPSPNADSQGSI